MWPGGDPIRLACGSRVKTGFPALRSLQPSLLLLREGDGIEETLRDWAVSVNASITQEGPVAARVFKQSVVDLGDENLFFRMGILGYDTAKGIGEEAAAPEFKTWAFRAVAKNVALLMADAVDAGNVD